MELAEELHKRGFIHDVANGDLETVLKEKRTAYFGIDPTADSLHVGNLVGILLAAHLKKHGHNIILLIGGATGQIGDPSGKSDERNLLDLTTLKKNADAQTKQVKKLFQDHSFLVVNNAKWLNDVSLISFLRDVGKHFTVNSLIKRDIVRNRLETDEQSISYTEFTYSLLQAYDFWYLNRTERCDLQLGASDQWANIVSGIDLIRKKEEKDAYGIVTPLITDASGKKFGKSEGNAIWLDDTKTTPYQFYQFWVNTQDETLEQYLKIFTFYSLKEIEETLNLHEEEPAKRVGQKTLAHAVTELIHGKETADAAEKVSQILFSGNISSLDKKTKEMLFAEAPVHELKDEDTIENILVASGLASSLSDARRLISAGSVRIGDEKITDSRMEVTHAHFKDNLALLKKGKRDVRILSLK